MFHHTVETDKPIEEEVSSLEASLKGEKFGVLWHFDIKETLESKGLEFDQLGGFFKLNHFKSCTSKSIIVPHENIYKERL